MLYLYINIAVYILKHAQTEVFKRWVKDLKKLLFLFLLLIFLTLPSLAGSQFPDWVLNLCLLQWKHRLLRKYPQTLVLNILLMLVALYIISYMLRYQSDETRGSLLVIADVNLWFKRT